MSPADTPLLEGPLLAEQAALVLGLAEAARQADGVAPLSEHAMLHVQHPGKEPTGGASRDLLIVRDGAAVAYAHLDPPGDGELVVHPAYRRQGYGSALLAALTEGAGPEVDGPGPGDHGIRLWAHGDLPAAEGFARTRGLTRVRSLWQMRKALGASADLPEPAFPAGVSVRTFVPGKDEEAWLRVNSRAFAHHPEQGSWTRQDLQLREAESWFDPAGFFLAERGGELIGFHWTKVHESGPDGTPEGEVYVVGVDPGQQGGGLGRALTLVGLLHLRDEGLAHVMLYVDEDNTAARRMYTNMGFDRWNADVMYERETSEQASP